MELSSRDAAPFNVITAGWLLVALSVQKTAGVLTSLISETFVLQKALFSFAMTIALYGVLLQANFVRGRIVGHGDVRAGLGDGPISRWPIIVAAGMLTIASVILAVVALYYGYIELSARSSTGARSPRYYLFRTFVAVLVAPPIEELWFRGWLWTGLRKHWSPFATALVTSAFFIAWHVPMTFASSGLHVVSATLFSLARNFGGSVRASIVIHAMWNLTLIATAAVFLLLYGDN